jgi:type I restriction enzyme S subunit
LELDDVVFITQDQHESMAATQLQPNDVLLNISGASIGRSCVVPNDFIEGNVNQHVCIIRCGEALDPTFISSLLNSWHGQRMIMESQAGGNRQGLNFEQIRKFKINVAPLPEQKKIAEILSTWDAAIATVSRLIESKRKLKKGLMQQLLTGKRRFPGFTEPWKITELGEMGRCVSGGTPDTQNDAYWNGEHYWCTPTEITKLATRYISATERSISSNGLKNSSAMLLPPGSLIVCTRATVGNCAINTVPMATNQGFKNLIMKKGYSTEFVYYLISQNKNLLIRYASGSTFLELSKQDFSALSFPVPEREEQNRITSLLTTVDSDIEGLHILMEKFQQQKRGLMQKLLTGQVRVKVDEEVSA